MQKGFAQPFLIIAAVIVLIIAGIYIYQSTRVIKPLQRIQSPISKQSNFKNYENTSLGFKFEYSKDYSVKIDSEEEFNQRTAGAASKTVNGDYRKNFKGYVGYEPGKFLGAVSVLDESNSFDMNPFAIWVFDNPTNLTIDRWFQNYWYYPYLWGVFDYASKGHVMPDKEATISGQVAKYKVVTYQRGKPKFMYLAKDQKMYLLRIIGQEGDKILSSFKLLQENTKKTDGCKIGGCSGQLCVEESDRGVSTCEYLSQYGCYKTAKCERQTDGKCNWTQTQELTACLKQQKI